MFDSMAPDIERGGLNGDNDSNPRPAGCISQRMKELVKGRSASPSSTEESSEANDDEYPHGFTLLFIGVALLMSVFLVGARERLRRSLVD